MANDVKVEMDTVKMRAVAKTIENQANIIRNCYDTISNDAQSLIGTHWDGSGADTYCERMKSLCGQKQSSGKTTAGDILAILREYSYNLNYTADEYDRTEGRVLDRVEGLPYAVFSV